MARVETRSPEILVGRPPVVTDTATIANSGTVSTAINTNGLALAGFQTDAAFDGTTITLQGAADGSTYVAIKDPSSGNAVSYTVAASGYYYISPPLLVGPSLKFVAGTSQTGASVITAVLSA